MGERAGLWREEENKWEIKKVRDLWNGEDKRDSKREREMIF